MDKKYKKVSILFSIWFLVGLVLLVSIGFVVPYIVNAQISVSPRLAVSPHTFEIDFFPGEMRTEEIKVTNKSEVALPILVRVVDFTASDETGGTSFDEVSEDPSISSRQWFEIY